MTTQITEQCLRSSLMPGPHYISLVQDVEPGTSLRWRTNITLHPNIMVGFLITTDWGIPHYDTT